MKTEIQFNKITEETIKRHWGNKNMNNELGNMYHYIRQNLERYKFKMNELKLQMGLELVRAKQFLEDNPQDDETFNSLLASIHLNIRRVKQMMDNASYMLEFPIKDDDYKYYDSSIINIARRYKKDPTNYIELSYSDALKELKEE